jgi:hypothetical protein
MHLDVLYMMQSQMTRVVAHMGLGGRPAKGNSSSARHSYLTGPLALKHLHHH